MSVDPPDQRRQGDRAPARAGRADTAGAAAITWCAVAICVTTAALLGRIARHGVDVPMSDQWEFVPTLTAWQRGTLGFADLAAPHNEHRLLVPRAAMIALAELTGWNTRAEMGVSVIVMGLTAAVGLAVVWRDLGRRAAVVVAPALGAVALTAAQAQNVLWGWQLQMPLAVGAGVVAAALAARRSDAAFIAGLVAAVVAQWSFGTGFTAWAAAIAVLGLGGAGAIGRTAVVRRVAVTAGVGSVSTLLAVRGAGTGSIGRAVRHPLRTARFTLVELGLPFAGRPFDCSPATPDACHRAVSEGTAIGAAIVITGFAVAVVACRRLGTARCSTLIGIGIGALGSCLLVAAGRGPGGIEAALESRYVTLAVPLWWSTGALATGVVLEGLARRRVAASPRLGRGDAARLATAITVAVAVAIGVTVRADAWNAWYRGREAGTLAFRAAVRSPAPTDAQLSGGYLAEVVRARLPEARALGWSAWRGLHDAPAEP